MEKLHLLLVCLVAFLLVFPYTLSSASMQSEIVYVQASSSATDHTTYRIIQHPLPKGSAEPWGITTDVQGRIWFVEQSSNKIGMYDPDTGVFSEYTIPTNKSLPESIAVASSDNVWITELQGQQLGVLYQNSTIREFKIPKGPQNLACGPIGVTPGPSGNIWLTCEFSNQIDEFFPSNSSFHEFNLPVFYSAPLQIVFDSQGNFWFSAADADMIGYVTVTQLVNGTSNGIDEFAPQNSTYARTISDPQQPNGYFVASLSTPSQIALAPDGNSLWITEHTASSFDQYNIHSKTLIKYWTSQTHNPNYITSLPNGIAIDNQGNVWIAEHYGNKIAEFNPSTNSLIEFGIPCCGNSIAGTLYLTLGKNGTVWFSEFYGAALGELKPISSNQSISIIVGTGNATLPTTGNLTVPVTVNTQNFQTNSHASLDISGISTTGVFQNSTATFSPSELILPTAGSATSVLTIKTNGLNPGIYYLTASAKISSTNVTYSTIFKLTILGSSSQFIPLFEYAAAFGVVASIAVIGAIVIIARRRSSRRLRKPSRRHH